MSNPATNGKDRPGKNRIEHQIDGTHTAVITVEHIGPAEASALLLANTHNRHDRTKIVLQYRRDMQHGNWDFAGDPLRIADDGTVLDGQHRLKAIAGLAEDEETATMVFPFIVVRGLPRETQDVMDTGAMRTMADVLTLHDRADPMVLAAIIRRLVVDQRAREGEGRWTPTRREMTAFAAVHLHETGRAAEVARWAKTIGRLPCAPSAIGVAYYLCARRNTLAADLFFIDQLIKGTGLEEGFPALTLQRRLRSESLAGRNMEPEDVIKYTLVAWNHFRAGSMITKLQAPRGGFPPVEQMEIK